MASRPTKKPAPGNLVRLGSGAKTGSVLFIAGVGVGLVDVPVGVYMVVTSHIVDFTTDGEDIYRAMLVGDRGSYTIEMKLSAWASFLEEVDQ